MKRTALLLLALAALALAACAPRAPDPDRFSTRFFEHGKEAILDTLEDQKVSESRLTAARDILARDHGEGGSNTSVVPIPLLDAQARYFSTGGVTQGYLFNVVPSFSYLCGTYSTLTGTTVALDTKELDVDDFFNGAYITSDVDQPRVISDYDGATRTVTVSNAFISAISQSGAYCINWPSFSPFGGFGVEGLSGSTWINLGQAVGTSLSD